MSGIEVDGRLSIPESELEWEFARSSGPGGQNVNKVETKATLRFDVFHSRSLTDEQRQRIIEHLGTRMTKGGVLRVVSQRHRTQVANQRAATERFVELLREALRERVVRHETKVPTRVRRARLEDKRRRARVKQLRARTDDDG